MSAIISVAAVQGLIDSGEAFTLLDVRNDFKDATAPYRAWVETRIPGSMSFDMAAELSSPRREDGVGGRNPMPTPAAFVAGLNRCGARQGGRIIASDARMEGVAARLWWVARELGIEVQVLDGGLAAWQAAGLPTASGVPVEQPTPGDWVVPEGIDPDVPVGADGRGTVGAMELVGPEPAVLVVDVRAPSRYRGDIEPNDRAGGHIPGAINVPNLDDDGAPASEELFASLLAHDGQLAASCGSGVSACLLLLRLAEAGRDDALLYPGSWSEWCALGLPVATGSA